MRTGIVAAALVLLTSPLSAAIQYEFVQKNTNTDDPIKPTSDMRAKATIDGPRLRVDFLGGSIYPPGNYVISTDGSQRLFFVDPERQWYTEYNAAGVTTAIGASNIELSGLKSSFVVHPDQPTIIDIPTEHSTLTLTYDIKVVLKGIPVKSHVTTEIESWMTTKYGDVFGGSLMSITRTGNAEIDKLIEKETSLKGFPLRQTVTTKTSYELPVRTELKVSPVKTIIRETWVTAVKELPPDAALFSIPKGFRRADTPDLSKPATDVLKFDPPTK